jgi:hypothetical protein
MHLVSSLYEQPEIDTWHFFKRLSTHALLNEYLCYSPASNREASYGSLSGVRKLQDTVFPTPDSIYRWIPLPPSPVYLTSRLEACRENHYIIQT